MNEDPISQARAALHDAIGLLPSVGGDPSASLAAALDRVAVALEHLGGLEARLAAQQALLDDRLVRIENNRLFTAWNTVISNALRLLRRPGIAPPNNTGSSASDYAVWVAHEQAGLPDIDEARASSNQWRRQPLFSLVMTIANQEQARNALASVRNQSYSNWELCVSVDPGDGGADPILDEVEAYGTVRRTAADPNADAERSLNAAASLAEGEYLCFSYPAGILSPLALHYTAESLQAGDYDLLYSDEDEIDAGGRRGKPKFKPDWSPALLTSCMYIGSLLAVSRRRFFELGGFRPGFGGAHLHDLALRITDRVAAVHHIGRVLFHATGGSDPAVPTDSADATMRAIEDAISRRENRTPRVSPGPAPRSFLVRGSPSPLTEMTAIICSKSPGLLASCLGSLRATAAETVRQIIVISHEETGPNPELRRVIERHGALPVSFTGAFNFSIMNNLGAAQARTPCFLFLNDDVRATAPGWAELLAEQLSCERVGIAGAVLWYPSGVLQHAGIVTGINDGVGHVGRYVRSSELWPWLFMTRNVSAVTGACLAIRADLFRTLGGFDPVFPNNYNDVDLCFRAREAGPEVVCVPVPGLVHAECQTRRGLVRFEERYAFFRRWALNLSRPDPYYSVSLSPAESISLNTSGESGYRPLLAKYQG
jgi:O-antigen biosynthesis protein